VFLKVRKSHQDNTGMTRTS